MTSCLKNVIIFLILATAMCLDNYEMDMNDLADEKTLASRELGLSVCIF